MNKHIAIMLLFSVNIYGQSTGLPVVSIQTHNGVAINSRDIWTDVVSFVLTDPNNPENNVSRINNAPNDRIRGRGNSTWGAPKKPYRVRFRENVSFFGLPAAENWVLLANYYDPTFLGNTFAFELGARLNVPYTPSYHHVELILNGVHQGSYLLTEHRQAAPQGVEPGPGRVGIDLTHGWLVEFDFRWHEEVEDAKFRTMHYNLPIVIKSPDLGNNANNAGYNIVRNDWNRLCNLMMDVDFPENEYREQIDMESIIDYFFVQIVTNNTDFYIGLDGRQEPGSIYFHKDKDAKITAGPLWDFDLSFRYGVGGPTANSRAYPTYPFFLRFLQDPVFRLRWKEKWNNSYSNIASMEHFIDEMAAKIRPSADADYRIWRSNQQISEFDRRIRMMKEYLLIRLNYMNSIYNTVDVFPTNVNFGILDYNNVSEIPEQTFTIVAYGTTELSARLRGINSVFEISTELTPTITEHGGFWATIGISPKNSNATGVYNDALIVSGTNQGRSFSVELPLRISIRGTTNSPELNHSQHTNTLQAWTHNNHLRVTNLIVGETIRIYNAAGVLIYNAIAAADTSDIALIEQGMYIIQAGDRTVKTIVSF